MTCSWLIRPNCRSWCTRSVTAFTPIAIPCFLVAGHSSPVKYQGVPATDPIDPEQNHS